jgi:tetratricopeptide (TPR) repeat protein
MKAGFTITFLLFFLIGKLFASYQSDSLKALLDSSQISEQQISLKLSAADEFMNSNIRESLLLAKQALEEAKRINSKRLTGEANLATGNYYGYMGMSSEALNHLHEALDIFSELKDPTKRIQALQLIGNVYRLSKEFELALDYYLEVGEYAEKELDSLLIIQSLLACGAVYGNISKMDSALVMFREAFELAKLISNKEAEVRSLYYIADVHLYSGKPDQALQLFHNLEKKL